MRVLAIDPGYDRLGLAVVEGDPSHPSLVWSDCVIPTKGERAERLAHIHAAILKSVTAYAPDFVAVETLFFSTNVKTAIGVAEARGVALAVAGNAHLAVVEPSPQAVKLAVTGNGRADKASVAHMVPKLIKLPTKKRYDDEFDALALALCALSLRQFTSTPRR